MTAILDTEVRTIRMDEADEFLELMCGAFDLDFGRAHDVFFSEPLFDLQRKWALFVAGEMTSIVTTTPLLFGWGAAIGIAGVATRADRRGCGHATTLLNHVLAWSTVQGEGVAMLFARDARVYERIGFVPVDEVVRAEIEVLETTDGPEMSADRVAEVYDRWSAAHPDRLRRDARRWNYWRWNYRFPTAHADGYVCHEPGGLREALFTPPSDHLPLTPGTQWFGTRLVADYLQLPLKTPHPELTLMARSAPAPPQLFMTDQF